MHYGKITRPPLKQLDPFSERIKFQSMWGSKKKTKPVYSPAEKEKNILSLKLWKLLETFCFNFSVSLLHNSKIHGKMFSERQLFRKFTKFSLQMFLADHMLRKVKSLKTSHIYLSRIFNRYFPEKLWKFSGQLSFRMPLISSPFQNSKFLWNLTIYLHSW